MKELIVGTVLILTFSAVAAININQTWQYRRLESALQQLERQQNMLYQDNKRLLGAITELEAPERLLNLAQEHPEWNLRQLTSNDLILIKKKEN